MQIKKIIMYIIVILLVIGICVLFVNLFNFNDKVENDIPEVTEELVDKLYSYIPENEIGYQAMYMGYFNTFVNIGSDTIQSMIYDYILNYEKDLIENVTNEEIQVNSITINGVGYNPSSKIKVSVFEDIFPLIFGKENTYSVNDFQYSYEVRGKLNETKDYFYIFDSIQTNNTNDLIFRDITRYAVTNNRETIEIYDYYLKCDLNTKN